MKTREKLAPAFRYAEGWALFRNPGDVASYARLDIDIETTRTRFNADAPEAKPGHGLPVNTLTCDPAVASLDQNP